MTNHTQDLVSLSRCCCCFLLFTLLVVFPGIAVALGSKDQYFYVTFHGGSSKGSIDIVQRFSMDGTNLGNIFAENSDFSELRGMFIDPQTQDLYVANAYKLNSLLLKFSACGDDGLRSYLGAFASKGLFHPYGIALWNKTIFASNQDSNDVSYFTNKGKFLGTFIGEVGSPRGLTIDSKGNVYVSSEEMNAVMVFNKQGAFVSKINVDTPIGLYYDHPSNSLFIGSNGDDQNVLVYNITTSKLSSKTFSNDNMSHPAGIVVQGNDLYVIGQKSMNLLHFKVAKREFVEVLTTFGNDAPEQLLISPC